MSLYVPHDAPAWFAAAIAAPTSEHTAISQGTEIRYRSWNIDDGDKPPLLFTHGFRGHSRWWDFVAPYFTDRFRVFALDFAGHGDSGHRENYSRELYSEDIIAVVEHAQLAPVIGIGHSFGGSRLLRTCSMRPELFARAIALDSVVMFADWDKPGSPPPVGNPNPYPDYASLRKRYRLIPDQPTEPWALDYIAHHSMREVDGGWSWKFDYHLPQAFPEIDGGAVMAGIPLPVTYVAGELSAAVSRERAQRIVDTLPQGHGPVILPQTHHHMMLDQPIALISLLRGLLA